jgi:acetyl esterase/lipase
MALEPQTRALIDAMESAGVSLDFRGMSAPEARRKMAERPVVQGAAQAVAKVEDRLIPGPGGPLAVRIYTPDLPGPLPVLVFFHGGGWVLGDLDNCDAQCRELTNAVGCVTISVDYRLAPEAKFPKPAEDCYEATAWVCGNAAALGCDPGRVAVGGTSAGANLAAAVALMAGDRGRPALAFQVLVYPITDGGMNTQSYQENAEGYFLTAAAMAWFWNHYVDDDRDRSHPYAAPINAVDLRGLAPALVITAEHDPLRDEGEAYAAKLRAAGVPVTCTRYDGTIHSFVSMAANLDVGKRAFDQIVAALKQALRK